MKQREKIDRFYESLLQSKFFDEDDGVIIPKATDESRFDKYLEIRRRYIQKKMCIEKGCKKDGSANNR